MAVDHPRRVRSFVRRPGRITKGQQRALDELLPLWGIPYAERTASPADAFGRDAERVLDIGFGDGEALLTAAARFPDIDYLGIEVHEPGIGHLLTLIERAGLTNIRIVDRDAVDVITQMLPDRSFDAVNLFFPDPWPKKRHHKRRIVKPEFVDQVARILKPDGIFHIATDWADYVEHIRLVMQSARAFREVDADCLSHEPLAFRAPTKFERRGRRLGHEVVDFYYLREAQGE
ncbi:MAG: tRNA (guanosine(46)-N7)-methyltransferase TrmB [Gammaproteobacteria bacterium]|jgi:tRNA (guanine-N7-)-methyltransferase